MPRLVDPLPFFGGSGLREVRVSAREARSLLAAAAILERVHDLLEAELGDGHMDLEPSLCGYSGDLRDLVEEGVRL